MPLCSPELAERIKEIGDLTSELLIQGDLKRVRWSDWFKANNGRGPGAALRAFGSKLPRHRRSFRRAPG